jgi:DNA polymerase-4
MLSYLVERACANLREIKMRARTVGVKVRYSDFEESRSSQGLSEPSCDEREIFAHAVKLLGKAWSRRMRVRLVGLELSRLSAGGGRQLDLFREPERERLEKLQGAVDRIRGKHGFGAVVAGRSIELCTSRGATGAKR